MALSGSAVQVEVAEAKKYGQVEGRAQGRKEGKLAGLRLAVEQLMKWANDARAHDDQEQGEVLEDAALNLAQIADKLEEEG